MRALLTALMAIVLGSAAVAADIEIPTPMLNAQEGQWVLMQEMGGDHAGDKVKFTVVKVEGCCGDGTVTLRSERFAPGAAEPETREFDIRHDRYIKRLKNLESKAKQISRERLTVKGKEIVTTAVSWDNDDDESEGDDATTHEFKIWVSEDLPVGGIVKSWSSDPEFPAAELIDYGMDK